MANPKMSNLNTFVQNKTAVPPEHPQHARRNLTRQQIASMKVSVPVTRTYAGVNRQADAAGAAPTHIGNKAQRDDTFGTDYTSSSASNASKVLIKDSQVDQAGKVFAKYDEEFGGPQQQSEEGSTEGSGSEESDDEYEDGGEEDPDPTSLKVGEVEHQQQIRPHINASIKSYPTTTSGRMNGEGVDNEISPRGVYNVQQPHLQQQHDRAAPVHRYAPQQQFPIQQFHPVHELRPPQQLPRQDTPHDQSEQMQQQSRKQPAQASFRQFPPQIAKTMAHRQHPRSPVKQGQHDQGGLRRTMYIPPQHYHQQIAAVEHYPSSTAVPVRTISAAGNRRVSATAPAQPAYEASETPALDYESAQLVKMSYDELHSEPYDHDPSPEGATNRSSTGLNESELSKPLPDRLGLVQKLAYENQAAFFSSLPLDEWEDAGEWFLERFGEIAKKMGEARKEKRGLSRAFESEIQKRHEAIDNKKRDIDEALSEMKNSGDQVLLRGSTPKRQKATASTAGVQ
jgi:hypothetical protein